MVRKLSSTGKRVFVTYYEHFKGQEDPMVFLTREDFTVQSKRTRAPTARYIFRQGWQHHALRYIIQTGRAAPEVIQKAREILEGVVSNGSGRNAYISGYKGLKYPVESLVK